MFGSPLEILIVYLLGVLGLNKNLRHGAIERVGNTTNLLGTLGNILKGDFLGNIFPRASAKLIDPKMLQTSFTDAFAGISKFFSETVSFLRDHVSEVAKRLEPEVSLRTWRIFGYLFQLLFLIAFAYADLIQLINNFAILFPQNVVQNPLLNNLNLSLLITSVGTAVTLCDYNDETTPTHNLEYKAEEKMRWLQSKSG